jgi:phosphatidylglycerophosphatase A
VEIDANQTKPTLRWMFQTAGRTLALGFGSGLSPFAPGTVGTLWAWALFLIGQFFFTTENWIWIIGGGLIAACWICGQVSDELGVADFGGIVLDEILAFWLVLLFILPAPFWMQALAFALFRFFDAVKPGPIGTIDRYFKDCAWIAPGSPMTIPKILWRGFGIVIDDLAAAFATLLILALLSTTQLLPSF